MTPGCEKLNIEPVEKREEMNLSEESGLKSEETSLLTTQNNEKAWHIASQGH